MEHIPFDAELHSPFCTLGDGLNAVQPDAMQSRLVLLLGGDKAALALNVCRDMRRSAWFRYVDRRVTLDHLPDPVEPVPDASIALMQEIMRLPRKLMEAVWLYYYEDMNMKDIGDMLGVAATTVGYRLDKARTLLRCRLGGGHPDEK